MFDDDVRSYAWAQPVALSEPRPRGSGSASYSLISAWCLAALVVAILSTVGCSKKPLKVFVPPRPQPQVIVPAKPPPIATVEGIETASVTLPEIPLGPAPELPAPAKPPAPRPNRPAAPKPAPPVVAVTPPPPKITAILTANQRREYTRLLDEYLAYVKMALETLAKKNLTPEQSGVVDQIRTFQKQAEQERMRDLETAVSLAKRADEFAKDLLRVP